MPYFSDESDEREKKHVVDHLAFNWVQKA